ncbi:Vacuole morphology and inheritance protein 14 [Dioscorea alata]|uniref:Vacuole morphology and inheritance protein 14 n=1 Tax=Dioscorea alata TaxID=55571 RepID=A0ACB7U6Z1_DIOAL|nr:Vacuole morphology and inheritance protein 14 [Dioscorea alata]
MLTPNCRHLLEKLDGISSDVLWDIGDESQEVYKEAFPKLANFVSKLDFEADREKILALIEYLSKELMHPSQPTYRKEGGLSGFVTLTTVLGKDFTSQLLEEILPPVLVILQDSSVRHAAYQAIYEIARVVGRGIIMFFDRIVYVFSLLPKDSDTVPSYTNDILAKIVELAATDDGKLSIEEFLNFLKGRMRKIHYKGRLFLLHWIQNNARGLVDDEWFIIEFIDAWFHKLSDPEPNEREKACQELALILSLIKFGHVRHYFI